MSGDSDGIFLGIGHNCLVLQAYLARCGLRVLSLDRAMAPGGGLATVENLTLPWLLAQHPFVLPPRRHDDALVPDRAPVTLSNR